MVISVDPRRRDRASAIGGRSCALAIAVLLGFDLATPSDVRADMLVIESNVPDVIAVGTCLHDDGMPNLSKGAIVRVLLFPSLETKLFQAPDDSTGVEVGGTRGVKPGPPPNCETWVATDLRLFA